jgi:hypothetical protein
MSNNDDEHVKDDINNVKVDEINNVKVDEINNVKVDDDDDDDDDGYNFYSYGFCTICWENAGPTCSPCFKKMYLKEIEIAREKESEKALQRENNHCN